MIYVSWIQSTSVTSSSIIFIKLFVAARECCRLVCRHLICVLYVILQCDVLVLVLVL